MNQFLTFIADTEKKHGKHYGIYQCVCGNSCEVRKDSVNSGHKTSCGCATKDGRTKHGLRGSNEYNLWSSKWKHVWPDFQLFYAELGKQPYLEAGIVPLTPGTEVTVGNAGWGYPRMSHGNDRINRELFMPLNPEQFNQYNIAAYEEEQETSWAMSLGLVTKQYDKLRASYPDLQELEAQFETLSINQALEKFEANERKTAGVGKSNGSTVWAQFKAHLLPLVIERMEHIHSQAILGRSGVHHAVVAPVLNSGLIDCGEIAHIALGVLFDALGDGEGYTTPLVKVFKTIGERIDNQMYFRWWEAHAPSDLHYADKWKLKSTTAGYSQKVKGAMLWLESNGPSIPTYTKVSDRVNSKGMDIGQESLIHLGEWVFQAIQSVCLWFEAVKLWPFDKKTKKRGEHMQYFLGLSAEGMRWKDLIKLGIRELLYDPMPMVCKPVPWPLDWSENGGHGGYLTPHPLGCSDLVHNNRGTKPSPEAIQALNNMQEVAWRVNPFMYHTLVALLGTGQVIKKFKTYERDMFYDTHMPQINPTVWNLDSKDPEYKKAKGQIARVHAKAKQEEKECLNPVRQLREAAKLLNYDRFYLPAFFDNRLRCYYLPILNPQGANHIKSLFLFADALEVTDENRDAVKRDLLITIANCWGEDKIALDDRVSFAEGLVRDLENVAKEPLSAGHLAAWSGCSEPFTFLAALRQYHEIFTWKTRTTTDIPCGRDASSSGLQILGSMARDEKSMTYTNMLSPDKPMDLYGEVARHAKALLCNYNWLKNQLDRRLKNAEKKAKRTGKDNIPEGGFKFELDTDLVDRSTMKRLVMVDAYNGSWLSKNVYVTEALNEVAKKEGIDVSLAEKAIVTQAGVDGQAQAFPVCKMVKEFYGKVVVAAIGENGSQFLEWKTPNGSIIRQKYNKKTARQIQTFALGGSWVYKTKTNRDSDGAINLSIQRTTKEVDPSRHATSLAPNHTHSLDAFIAQDILYRFNKPMAACHDCWYPRAGEVDECLTVAKQAMLTLVTSDVMDDLCDRNGVAGVNFPRLGSDKLLDKVMESGYIFA